MSGKKGLSLLLALLMVFSTTAAPASAVTAEASAVSERETLLEAAQTVIFSALKQAVISDFKDGLSMLEFVLEATIYTLQVIAFKDTSVGSERKLDFVAQMGGKRWTLTKDITISDTINVSAPYELCINANGHRISKKNEDSQDPIFITYVSTSLRIMNARLSCKKGCCIVNKGYTVVEGGTCVTATDDGSIGIFNQEGAALELLDMSCSSILNYGEMKMPEGYSADVDEVISKNDSRIAMDAGHIGTLQTHPDQVNNILSLNGGKIDRYETLQPVSFAWPLTVEGYISAPYGFRRNPLTGARSFHEGVDITAIGINGKPILASEDGEVVTADYNRYYGNYVVIKHDEIYSTLYAQCSKLLVKVGDHVTRGQQIAAVGSTGRSTGPHLHFEVREYGNPVFPLDYATP